MSAPDKYTQYLERLAREDEARREKQRRSTRIRDFIVYFICCMLLMAALGVFIMVAYVVARRQ